MLEQLRVCKKCLLSKSFNCFSEYTNKTSQGRRHVCIECRQKENTESSRNKRNSNSEFYGKKIEANKKYRTSEAYKNHLIRKRETGKLSYYNDVRNRLGIILDAAEKRANRKGVEFSLTIDLIYTLMFVQDFKCLKTGLNFDFQPSKEYHKNPLAPSIDRKNSDKGYTLENIQIVCVWYNIMKNEWSDEMIKEMIRVTYIKMFSMEQ